MALSIFGEENANLLRIKGPSCQTNLTMEDTSPKKGHRQKEEEEDQDAH